VTEKILEDCQKIGIKKIWMQSGSESQKAIEFCRRNKIDFLAGTCIILDSNN
jgi:predicted CoA-binding protein